jgi:hypothetical protein
MAAKERFDESLDVPVESLESPHPVGTGVGVASGAIAGAALGATGGPAGALVGGVIGALAGGLTGLGVAELANPKFPDEEQDSDWGNGTARTVDHHLEDAYWREAHAKEPYYNPEHSYGDYAPAYRMGWVSCARYDGGNFEKYEPAFRNDWESIKGDSRLDWDEARHAVKAGWHRIERTLPGDADGDSR